MEDYSQLEVIDVDCCVCGATGNVPRFIWWTRDCNVCDGKGQRPIVISKAFTPSERNAVLSSALYGFNRFGPRPVGLMDALGLGSIL